MEWTYNEIREILFCEVNKVDNTFATMNNQEKLVYLMSNENVCGYVARALHNILEKRILHVYN